MFRFEHPYYLYLLIALPLWMLIYVYSAWSKKRAIKKLGDENLVKQLMPDFKLIKQSLKFLLLWLAAFCIIIALANPQMGSKIEKVKRKGIDVFIALDVSKSMMAEDVKPNRLTRAKQAVSNLIDELNNDKVGLITFAGRSYLQMPLTVDYSAAKMFLQNANCDMVPTQGTAIGAAIDQAVESFQTKDKKHKAVIVISDGENHEDDAIESAKAAVNEGAVVYTVGVGSEQGAPIPVYQNGVQTDFKKDENGSIVLSKLNQEAMKEIAEAGKGSYFQLSNSQSELKSLVEKISTMEQKTMDEHLFTDYEDYFQYFLLAAFILLSLEIFVSEKPTQWLLRLKKIIPVLFILFLVNKNSSAQSSLLNPLPELKAAREALKQYKLKNSVLADSLNTHAIRLNKNFGEAYYNKGNLNFEKDSFRQAAEDFKNATALLKDDKEKAKAFHNLGNSQLQQRNYNDAIDAYKQALKLNSNDRDTKYNLAYAQAMLKNQPKQKQNKNDKDKKNDKNQQNKNQQQNKGDNKQNQNQQKKDDKKGNDKNQQNQPQQGNKGDDKKEGKQPKPGKISKEDAEKMLNHLRAEEQKTKQNADKKNTLVTQRKSVEKDW